MRGGQVVDLVIGPAAAGQLQRPQGEPRPQRALVGREQEYDVVGLRSTRPAPPKAPKLGIREGSRVLLVGAPAGLDLGAVPTGAVLR